MNNFLASVEAEEGLELSEYALAAALIALAVIVGFQTLGGSIGGAIRALAGVFT